jgi:hypothetical protein
LQAYADRGVFRGFRATPAPRGRVEYQFLWLTRTPMRAVFDSRRRRLSFASLFPAIDHATAAELRSMVAARATRVLPEHKRLDARRARFASAVRIGDFSLSVEIRGSNHAYAVKRSLNLVNELFLALQERHPDYLIERFGFSTE